MSVVYCGLWVYADQYCFLAPIVLGVHQGFDAKLMRTVPRDLLMNIIETVAGTCFRLYRVSLI